MRTVWKYPVFPHRFHLAMPTGAKVLAVQAQGDDPAMWVQVDSDAPLEPRWFHVVGTGHELPDDVDAQHGDTGWYIGTWQLDGLVWHLFEVPGLSAEWTPEDGAS